MEKMDKIKKYVDRFITTARINDKYDMSFSELRTLTEHAIGRNTLDTVSTTFNFGYAKGYRAAMAEMKKKGGAA